MSTAAAIAAVTAVLKDLLDDAVADASLDAQGPGLVRVTATTPTANAATEGPRINLLLHAVTPNARWRNEQLPARGAAGERTNVVPLALDLHYLLTVYGTRDLDAEVMLGHAMQVLHRHPILSSREIAKALSAASAGPLLPDWLPHVATSGLADQAEPIRITPELHGIDEITKLVTAHQLGGHPTVAYTVSVVLIEPDAELVESLPVLTVGPVDPGVGRPSGVAVAPSAQWRHPTVRTARAPHGRPAVCPGEALELDGIELAGAAAAVVTDMRTGASATLPAEVAADGSRATVALPVAAPEPLDGWRCGTYQIALTIGLAASARTTNAVPFALGPRIAAGTLSSAVEGDDRVVTFECRPPVQPGQRVEAIIGDAVVRHAPLGAASSTLRFVLAHGAVDGDESWVRVRVDGIESVLVDRTGAVPVFDPTQRVTP